MDRASAADTHSSAMIGLPYSFRARLWLPETTYWLDTVALHWRNQSGGRHLDYSAIHAVRVYKVRYFGSRGTYWRCVLHYGIGRKISLQAAHVAGFRRIEDRTGTYIPFVKQLESRIAASNPRATFRRGRQTLAVFDAALGGLVIAALRSAAVVGLEPAAAVSAWLMRTIGPWLKGQRVARINLAEAYPDKTATQIDLILRGMWDNIGRTFAEYMFLCRIWDFEREAGRGRISLADDSSKALVSLRARSGEPGLFFGAHLGHWELLPFALGCRNGLAAVVYRSPQTPSVARELARRRSSSKAVYIPANVDVIFKIKALLRRGAFVCLSVDEHFARGAEVEFFGRRCSATPILARLARQFECPIYGGRIVRVGTGRFRFDITGPIEPVRDSDGKIDVTATTQLITTVIEGWVKEFPEQWLWLQRRWR
jgi:Kdo2-lipid IVA lauroyltransferase/acyltransferase